MTVRNWAIAFARVPRMRAAPAVSLTLAALLALTLIKAGAQPYAVGLFAPPWDKLAHAAVFGCLALLLHIGLRTRRPLTAIIVAAAIGLCDELHQSTLPGRVAGMDDFATDVAAAAGAVLLAQWTLGICDRRA